MRFPALIVLAALAMASPAQAKSGAVDVPAGRAGDAAVAIARQTGTSIVIADGVLAERRIPAIRGRYSASQAVKQLAKAANAKAVKVGKNAWRIVVAPAPRRVAERQPPADRAPRVSYAPAPPPAEPVEIVVVGSKRETELRDYAGQVEIVAGDDLTFGGAGGTEKIMQRVPTVSSTHLGSGRNKLFIRGIADSSFTGPTQSTVGQYFGDLRLSYNAPDPDLRMTDLSRVEVLEGPQGTLYGAGSLGGILRLVPNEPEMGVTAGSAMLGGSATQHGAFGGDASLTANLPVSGESVALRVTLDAASEGGYIDKPLLGRDDVNRTNIVGGRAILRFDAGNGWTVDLIGIGQTIDGEDSQYADRTGPPLTRASRVAEGFDTDYAQGQFVVSGAFGDIRFRSSTGYTVQELEERYDATMPDEAPRLFTQSNDTEMFANETRLWQPLRDRVGWLLGASFTHNSTSLRRTIETQDFEAATTGVRNTVDELTFYGEASFRLFEGVTATAGARYTHSSLGGEGEDIAFAMLSPADTMLLAQLTAERGESVFLPSASISAVVLPETTLYLRYQEGFRPGGLAIAGDIVTRFRNDYVSTFEFGARHGGGWAGPLELAANVSYTRWTDIQADFIDSAGFPSTANIGDGTIWTFSFTGSVELTPELRVDGGFSIIDSRVDEPLPLFTSSRATQVPNIADFAGRIGFDYMRPVGDDLTLTARGWVQYVGKSRLGVGPELGELQGDYLDSGLVLRLGRPQFGVTLGVSNLTDEKGNRFALGTPFAIGREQITPLRPRTVRIGLDAAF